MNIHLSNLLSNYPSLNTCRLELEKSLNALIATYEVGGKLLLCGNGGSASDCEHIVGELMKGFMSKRPLRQPEVDRLRDVGGELGIQMGALLQLGLPAISLTSPHALVTAIVNDIQGDLIFAQQVQGLGRQGDCLLGITTSGNSQNVINACINAKALGLTTIVLTGRSGGRILNWADCAVCAPADTVAAIQELHLPIYHFLCMALESHFFSKR